MICMFIAQILAVINGIINLIAGNNIEGAIYIASSFIILAIIGLSRDVR